MGGGDLCTFCKGHHPPPAQLASIVVQPYHVAHNLKLLFLRNNNGANIFSVKFCLHFNQKYYAINKSFDPSTRKKYLLSLLTTLPLHVHFVSQKNMKAFYFLSLVVAHLLGEKFVSLLLLPPPSHSTVGDGEHQKVISTTVTLHDSSSAFVHSKNKSINLIRKSCNNVWYDI